MKQKIQMTFPADLHYSSLIRHIADEIFRIAKFSKAWCGRLKSVVDELFMNSVRYGSTKNESKIYITFAYDEDELEFVIEDDGTGEKAVSVEELRNIIQKNEKNTDLARTSGRGLSMITKLWTDTMEIENSQYGGIRISFGKKIETTTPPIEGPIEPSSATATEAPGPVVEIKLSEEIDKLNIGEKIAPIYEQMEKIPEGGELVLDFDDVTYINSTFIGNLAAWYSTLEHKGGHIRVKNLSDQVKEVLNVVGLLKLLKINST